MKNKYGFILVKPQLGENIGACARSMKNFGFSKLHIVSPKFSFPNHKTKVTSVGAFDIINKTKVFDEIQRSNMSKLSADGKPVIREDGKILKGPNYFRPNIKSILEK